MKLFTKNIVLIVLTLTCISVKAKTISNDICPVLPTTTKLLWANSDGPDYRVCYAENENGAIGVYFGFHPEFDQNNAFLIRKSQINNSPINWYHLISKHKNFKVGFQTIHELKFTKCHIWVMAKDEKQLEKFIKIAESLKFRD